MPRKAPHARSGDDPARMAARCGAEPVRDSPRRADSHPGSTGSPGSASLTVDLASTPGLAGLSLPQPASSLRRTATGTDPLGGAAIPTPVITALRRRQGGGQPLPETLATSAGQTLGQDLSAVRVHTDAEADHIARSVQSVAFSYGTDVYFTSGSYRPEDAAGQQLLGHELAHVAQADSGSGGVIGRADDPVEAAADHAGSQVVAALRRRASQPGVEPADSPERPGGLLLRRRPAPTIRRVLDDVAMTARYGLTDPLVIADPALNTIFETDEAEVKAVLTAAPTPAKVKEFRLFLRNGNGADTAARWTALKAINAHLGSSAHRLSKGSQTQYLSTGELNALLVAIAATSAETKVLLRPMAAETLAGTKLQAALAPPAAGVFSIDQATALAVANGGNAANPALANADVRRRLHEAHAAHPPGTARPALAWGTGNSAPASVVNNIRDHAIKHMLRVGNPDNPDQHEPFKWMQALGYVVDQAFVEAALGTPTPAPDATLMYDPAGVVATQAQADHFFNTFLAAHAPVKEAMIIAHAGAYQAHVVASAATMTGVTVTAEGGKVQIVGQDGPLFIAGRWEGPGLGFTISSGYMNTAKWAANQACKVYNLT